MLKGALKILLLFVIIAAIVIAIILVKKAEAPTKPAAGEIPSVNQFKNMNLTSTAFGNNENIPPDYTCDNDNVSPPLEIGGVPESAKSLVLIVDDPDAPAGDWVHWTLWNIAPDTKEIPEDSVPDGAVEGTTSFGRTGYGGPCPPSGIHHYQFKLYALDTTLNLDASVKKQDIEKAMEGHIIDQTVLVGLYQRK